VEAVSDVRDEEPGSGEAMTIAGLGLIQLGNYRGGRQALDRALKLQPNQFDAATTLAELNFGLGDGRRGLEVLRQAAQLRPREFRIWLVMGKVLHDLGDSVGAIQAFEKALEIKPDDRQALIGLIRSFEAALALDPSFESIRARIATLRANHPELTRESSRATLFSLGAAAARDSSATGP
jgi:Flp pilus assembly protein TadD